MNINFTQDQIEAQRQACIAAFAAGIPSITIEVDADLTPAGNRTARIVQTSRGGRQLRWYVSGRVYREFGEISAENVRLTNAWISA